MQDWQTAVIHMVKNYEIKKNSQTACDQLLKMQLQILTSEILDITAFEKKKSNQKGVKLQDVLYFPWNEMSWDDAESKKRSSAQWMGGAGRGWGLGFCMYVLKVPTWSSDTKVREDTLWNNGISKNVCCEPTCYYIRVSLSICLRHSLTCFQWC